MGLQIDDFTAEFMQLIRQHAALFYGAIFAIGVFYFGVDLLPGRIVANLASTIVGVYGQYHFLERVLSDHGRANSGRKPRYGSLFIAALLGGLGIVLGIVLLILPGVYLMARWSISSPFVVVEGMSGNEALKASWQATAAARWPLFVVFLIYLVAAAALIGAAAAVSTMTSLKAQTMGLAMVLNLIVSAATVFNWTLAAAIYRCIKPSTEGVAEVFS